MGIADQQWHEASDVIPMFPTLVWKIRLAAALRGTIADSTMALLAEERRAPGPSVATYELYMRGKRHLFSESLSDFVSAVDCFERAREADPGFALAWAGDFAAVLLIAIRTYRLIFHPEEMQETKIKTVE